jgi:thiamine-monophosphate kinase
MFAFGLPVTASHPVAVDAGTIGASSMTIDELGEFGVIERIARFLPGQAADVVVGVGDDVAVLRTSAEQVLLATCDIQVENVHFLRSASTPYQLGRKAIAINVSDIAAMGGQPTWALVSLALPPDTEAVFVDELYRGMLDQLQAAGAAIVGGNLSKIDGPVVIDLFLLGQCAANRFVCRRGARPGDALLVTGTLGDSRAGLELLRRPDLSVARESREQLLAAHLTPQPRLAEGRLLAGSGLVHAMLDVSDGTLSDLRHMCEASNVGAELFLADLPISAACRDVARALQRDTSEWALAGGEDYQLMFTVACHDVERIRQELEEQSGTSVRVVGRMLPAQQGILVKHPDGSCSRPKGAVGWDHFRRHPPA